MTPENTATAHTATPEAAEGKCARCLDSISSVLVHILGRWYCFGCVTELAMDKLTEEHERAALASTAANRQERAAVAGSAPAPSVPTATIAPPSPVRLAKSGGFTGNACLDCGGFQMVRSGTCERCLDCGATTGCS